MVMDALIRLITSTVIRGSIYKSIRNTGPLTMIALCIVSAIVFVVFK